MQALHVVALATLGTGFALALAACEPYAPKSEEQMELHPVAARPIEGPQPKWEWVEDTADSGDASHGDDHADGAHAEEGHGDDEHGGGHDDAGGHWVQIGQIGAGAVTGEAIDQPIAFTHYRHVTVLGMDCQYCHTYARESNYAGVPPVEMCMGCHTHVRTESPQIMQLTEYWENDEPVPWQKVHDLPDFVHFAHKRHVRAGVECIECHGQVPLMGRWPDGDPEQAQVMVRESPLQMGWCLDCHAEHPSIDENYGEDANVRRAELKDCWTCHK